MSFAIFLQLIFNSFKAFSCDCPRYYCLYILSISKDNFNPDSTELVQINIFISMIVDLYMLDLVSLVAWCTGYTILALLSSIVLPEVWSPLGPILEFFGPTFLLLSNLLFFFTNHETFYGIIKSFNSYFFNPPPIKCAYYL